jgi:predicted ATP-dependent protease
MEGCDNMNNCKKLESKDLEISFDFLPEFEYTTEISPYKDMIGQDKAIEAMELGLLLDGYNIFVCGVNGTGKRSYVQKCLKEYSKKEKKIYDWCYVNNFIKAERPIALWIASGKALEFKEDMDALVNELVNEVPKYFSNSVVEKIRNQIVSNQQKQVLNIVDNLYSECKKKNFIVKNSGEGFTFTPLINDEEMTEKQYNELTEEEKENINEAVSELKLFALEVMRKSKIIKKELMEELKELDEKSATPIINSKIEKLNLKYAYNPEILDYLSEVEADIIANIDIFIDDSSENDEQYSAFFKRYSVNIMSSNAKEIPVVMENYPEYHNLIGRIEYESKSGTITTDFTMIKPGSLHEANGGYIIIDAYQLLTYSNSWDLLKRCITNKIIGFDTNKNQLDVLPMVSFKPQGIPLDIKVILIGTPYIYYLLLSNDETIMLLRLNFLGL